MATTEQNKQLEYLTRLALAEGHRRFGLVAARKEPKDEDDSGDGSSGLEPPPNHPLLGAAAQFSGEFQDESPVAAENREAAKELQNRLEAKLDKKLQAEKHINPTPSMRG